MLSVYSFVEAGLPTAVAVYEKRRSIPCELVRVLCHPLHALASQVCDIKAVQQLEQRYGGVTLQVAYFTVKILSASSVHDGPVEFVAVKHCCVIVVGVDVKVGVVCTAAQSTSVHQFGNHETTMIITTMRQGGLANVSRQGSMLNTMWAEMMYSTHSKGKVALQILSWSQITRSSYQHVLHSSAYVTE